MISREGFQRRNDVRTLSSPLKRRERGAHKRDIFWYCQSHSFLSFPWIPRQQSCPLKFPEFQVSQFHHGRMWIALHIFGGSLGSSYSCLMRKAVKKKNSNNNKIKGLDHVCLTWVWFGYQASPTPLWKLQEEDSPAQKNWLKDDVLIHTTRNMM